jgi:hypothetical protein
MVTLPVSKARSHLLGCGLIKVGYRDAGASSANRTAHARPIPWPPPVTITAAPAKRPSSPCPMGGACQLLASRVQSSRASDRNRISRPAGAHRRLDPASVSPAVRVFGIAGTRSHAGLESREDRLPQSTTGKKQPGTSLISHETRSDAAGGRYPLTYNVTPGSLTSWSVQVLRRTHRSTAPVSTSNAAIRPNPLAFIRRFPIDRR